MSVLVSVSGIVRLVALGFALGIVVGLYFGLGGRPDPGAETCTPDRPVAQHCVPADDPPPAEAVNPDAAP
jgi:hypothetical protein